MPDLNGNNGILAQADLDPDYILLSSVNTNLIKLIRISTSDTEYFSIVNA